MSALQETIFVIDDDKGLRTAIGNLLESAGWKVEAFSSPSEFLKKHEMRNESGCLVLDVRLPGASGLQFQQALIAAKIEIPIIFVTAHADVPMSVQAMKAGAVDFLTKPFRDQELLDAVSKAIEGGRARSQQETEITGLRERHESLTAREREVFELVNRGLLNKQVAAELGMSETTAKIHRGQVMRKMRAESLPDLVRIAEKLGITARRY
jgi:FixJ family two-component response regulator